MRQRKYIVNTHSTANGRPIFSMAAVWAASEADARTKACERLLKDDSCTHAVVLACWADPHTLSRELV